VIGYHLTSLWHLPRIEASGGLKPGESNIGCPREMADSIPSQGMRIGEHVGPDVVWLFDTPEPTLKVDGAMLRPVAGARYDKRLVRITVEVPDAQWWPEWSRAHGIDRPWYKLMARGGRPQEWYVVARRIPVAEFVNVEVRHAPDAPWQAVGLSVPR
jgi:hypothetical protein